jgi:K+ transporter
MMKKKGSTIEGQIYIPAINFLLMVCCLLLVIGFRTSERLAGAYGVAVCGDIYLIITIFFLPILPLKFTTNFAPSHISPYSPPLLPPPLYSSPLSSFV